MELVDEMLWLVLAGLMVAVGIMVWTRGSLRKEISQIGTEIKTTSATVQALSNIVTSEIGSEVKTTSAFVQGLRDLVTTVNQGHVRTVRKDEHIGQACRGD
jgi:adenosyl cobinamide kinase/adenosyl cobinamide phosphate guanylyltransferase